MLKFIGIDNKLEISKYNGWVKWIDVLEIDEYNEYFNDVSNFNKKFTKLNDIKKLAQVNNMVFKHKIKKSYINQTIICMFFWLEFKNKTDEILWLLKN